MNFYFYGREWQKGEVYFLDENKKRIKYQDAFENWLLTLEKTPNLRI